MAGMCSASAEGVAGVQAQRAVALQVMQRVAHGALLRAWDQWASYTQLRDCKHEVRHTRTWC